MDSSNSACCQSKHYITWLVAALAVGLAVGCASGALQQAGRSLLLLQSVAIGAVAAILLMGAGGMVQRRPPSWGALLAGLATVATQHVWLYKAAMAARRDAVNEQAAVELFKPGWSQEGFVSYLLSVGLQPNGAPGGLGELPNALLWGIDGVLVILSAVMIVRWVGRASRPAGSERMND